jgi:hypothetical protein
LIKCGTDLTTYHVMEANGGLELQVALTCALREEGEQLDIPTALPPRREPPVIVDEHVKCDLQPV